MSDHWFEGLADFMGPTYLRYSFTKGTTQEVDFLVEELDLAPGSRVLDVGCGPGRHSLELAARGHEVLGVDISQTFIDLATQKAPPNATFRRMDARELPFEAEFDAVVCLCQGAFGLMTEAGGDARVAEGISRALKPGGRLALSAFNAFFVVKHFNEGDFDPSTGVCHEHTEIKSPQGDSREADLWTGCYTPRELRLLFTGAGLRVDHIHSVDPGSYRRESPSVESSEYLVIASKAPFRR